MSNGYEKGYRLWEVKEGRLRSVAMSNISWEPRVRAEAVCKQYEAQMSNDITGRLRPHVAPNILCDCGIWAVNDPKRIVEYTVSAHMESNAGGSSLFVYTLKEHLVLGRVALWGKTVEGELGWRSQYAYPQLLYYRPLNEAVVRELASMYAVEIEQEPPSFMTDAFALVAQMNENSRRSAAFIQKAYTTVARIMSQPMQEPEDRPIDWKHSRGDQIAATLFGWADGKWGWWRFCSCGHVKAWHSAGCLVRGTGEGFKSYGYCNCEGFKERKKKHGHQTKT
jgi:hypothetical protein